MKVLAISLAVGFSLAFCLAVSPLGAFQVSGRVLDPTGAPAPGVDIDFIDRATGDNLPLPNDLTDAGGLYSVDVPAGPYRIRYKPPQGVRWVAFQEQTVWITGDEVRADTQLEEGWVLSGTMLDHQALPVDNGDIDVVNSETRRSVFLVSDNTDASGFFSVVVPCGVFDVTLEPPSGHADAAIRITGLEIACTDVSLGNVSLVLGHPIRGTVTERVSGLPVFDADLDVEESATGIAVPTPRDDTDPAGAYQVVVPPGVYTVDVEPPPGHRALPAVQAGVAVAGPTDLNFLLETGVFLSGTVTAVADGAPIESVDLNVDDSVSGRRVDLASDDTDFSGFYQSAIPPGEYDLLFRPPAGSPYLHLELTAVPVPGDTVRDVQLDPGLRFRGRVLSSADGSPIPDVDLNLFHPVSGWVFLSYDDTGADGRFVLTVEPSADYALVLEPAETFVARRIEPVDVLADETDLGDLFLDPGVEIFGRVLRASDRTPLPDVDLDFVHETLGTVLATDDDTNADGIFRAWLPEGLYDVEVTPDLAMPYAPTAIQAVSLTFPGPVDLGDILLEEGVLVTGRVVEEGSGVPLAGVDLDLEDPAGTPVFLDGDDTQLDGTFSIRAAAGSYLLDLDATQGGPYLPKQLWVDVVPPATDLGVIELEPASELIGRVVRASDLSPVAAVDLDVYDSSLGLLQTPGDDTAADGTFSILVPLRPDLRVDFEPPVAEKLAAVRLNPVATASPQTDLGDIALQDALELRGTVVDPRGAGVVGADVDVFESGTGTEILTPNDSTLADGSYSVLVPGGMYDVRIKTPDFSNLSWEERAGVLVAGDPTVVDFDVVDLLVAIAPDSGAATGGTPVTVSGVRFDAATVVTIGGIPLQGPSLVDPQTITGTTGGRRAGPVDVEAAYASGERGWLPAGFEFLPSPNPVDLRVSRSGSEILLEWTDAGQAEYLVTYSDDDPSFPLPTELYRGPSPQTTDASALGGVTLRFYDVQ